MKQDYIETKGQNLKTGMTNRTKQALATKNKIFNIGIKLLRNKGFNEVNVQQITKEAGVSVGTFYHHFDSKLDLFMTLYRIADEHFETYVKQQLEGHNSFNKIIIYFHEYTKLPLKDGLKLVKKIYIPDNKMFLSQPRMFQLLHEIIIEGQENGDISKELSAEELSDSLVLLARGVVFDWALRDGSYDLQDKMKEIISHFIAAYVLEK